MKDKKKEDKDRGLVPMWALDCVNDPDFSFLDRHMLELAIKAFREWDSLSND